jgi:hypothetical protein
MLQANRVDDKDEVDLSDDPDVSGSANGLPMGFGRFLFRMSAIEERIHTALPYLDTLSIHLLFGTSKNAPTRRCTLVAASADRRDQVVPDALEREILIDVSPEVFRTKPSTLPQSGMTPEERTRLAVELAHSVPFPPLLKKLAFGTYRLWFRVFGSRTG